MKHLTFHMRSAPAHFCYLSLAVLDLGCGSQVSSEYLGESLISVRGSVVIDNPAAPAELVPVVLFETGPLSNIMLIEDVVHRGEFPSRFQLSVFEAPPEAAFMERETKSGRRVRYAWGNIGAVAPEHPSLLALTALSESSYCLGRECYTDRTRCDVDGSCYEERYHCSLPARFDERAGVYSNCREVGTQGDIGSIPVAFEYSQHQGEGTDDGCTESSCRVTYEWCIDPDTCEPRPDGSCHPPVQNCYGRTVECDYDADSQRPSSIDEIDPALWPERDDLSNCGVVMRQGNLEYAESYHEWLAGSAYDAFLLYLPEDVDPVAFEEAMGLAAPEEPGYSLLVYAAWDEASMAAYRTCADTAWAASLAAFNLEHGTDFTFDDSFTWSDELALDIVYDSMRCEHALRAYWHPDPMHSELQLHVGVPSFLTD